MEVASNGSTNPEDNPVDNIFLNQTFSILPELNFISFCISTLCPIVSSISLCAASGVV